MQKIYFALGEKMKLERASLFINEGNDVANAIQGENGYIEPDAFEEIRDRVVDGQVALYEGMIHQVKLQIRWHQELRRRAIKLNSNRSDMAREQETAVYGLQKLLKRYEKMLGWEIPEEPEG